MNVRSVRMLAAAIVVAAMPVLQANAQTQTEGFTPAPTTETAPSPQAAGQMQQWQKVHAIQQESAAIFKAHGTKVGEYPAVDQTVARSAFDTVLAFYRADQSANPALSASDKQQAEATRQALIQLNTQAKGDIRHFDDMDAATAARIRGLLQEKGLTSSDPGVQAMAVLLTLASHSTRETILGPGPDLAAAKVLAAGPFHPNVPAHTTPADLQAALANFGKLFNYLQDARTHPEGVPAYQMEAANKLVPVLEAAAKLPQVQAVQTAGKNATPAQLQAAQAAESKFVIMTLASPNNEKIARDSHNPAMAHLYVLARTVTAVAEHLGPAPASAAAPGQAQAPAQDPWLTAVEKTLRQQAGPMVASASAAPSALSKIPTQILPQGVSRWHVAWCSTDSLVDTQHPGAPSGFPDCKQSTIDAKVGRTPDGLAIDAGGRMVQATLVPIPGGFSALSPDRHHQTFYTVGTGDANYPKGSWTLRPSFQAQGDRAFNTEYVFWPAR